MTELDGIRRELDKVDAQLVRLFEERMRLARRVARCKMAHGLPVLDAGREQQVIQSRRALLQEPRWGDSLQAVFETLMLQSRKEQERLIKEEGAP